MKVKFAEIFIKFDLVILFFELNSNMQQLVHPFCADINLFESRNSRRNCNYYSFREIYERVI